MNKKLIFPHKKYVLNFMVFEARVNINRFGQNLEEIIFLGIRTKLGGERKEILKVKNKGQGQINRFG